MPDATCLNSVLAVAHAAAQAIMAIDRSRTDVVEKENGSPVTKADRVANLVIVPALRKLTPDIPVVSEENVAAGDSPDISGGTFWLVDPLDGTKEYINGNDDFTVNIGLIQNRGPVLGVVLTPADRRAWAGIVGHGAFEQNAIGQRQPIKVRDADPNALTVVASRSHRSEALETFIAARPVKDSIARGSALKFCLVARGDADLYPRTGPTMEWDTAAGHAILLAAGGTMELYDGGEFRYGKPDFLNGWFVVRGGGNGYLQPPACPNSASTRYPRD